MKPIIKQHYEEIKNLFLSGKSRTEISEQFNCSLGTICNALKEFKAEENDRRQKRNDIIYTKFCQKIPIEDIAGQFEISVATVYQILKKFGLTFSSRKYFLNENYFNQLNPESAYWVGFLLADGCIRRHELSIGLSQKDRDHLIKFRDCISSNYPIHDRGYKRPNLKKSSEYCYSYIYVSSKSLVDSLIKIGVIFKKSLVHSTPLIPKELLAPMYLGYFDGDGSIFRSKTEHARIYRITFIGPKIFCLELNEWISEIFNLKLNFNPDFKTKLLYVLSSSTRNAIKILTYLYNHSPVFLDRKFELYREMVKDHNNDKSKVRASFSEEEWFNILKTAKLINN